MQLPPFRLNPFPGFLELSGREREAMKKKRLGEVLRERGHLSAADLNKALLDQQGKFIHLGELLLQRGMIAKIDLISALAEVSSIPYLDCMRVKVDPEALKSIPFDMAKRCAVLPLGLQESSLVVVMAEPQNFQIVDELRFKTGLKIVPRLGFRGEIQAAINKHYGVSELEPVLPAATSSALAVEQRMEFISYSDQQRNVEAMREMQSELHQKSKTTPAVQIVASMIQAAAAKKASDIHVEPQASDTSIRFRVDGILREHLRVPKAHQNSVTSRIKILSDMDISERRAPQDGRFLVKIGDSRIDLRVSTLPTQYGEKVVMRLLGMDAPLQDFSTLGFPPGIADQLKNMLTLPQGMILVTGPTGSGKSTTLYSCLNVLRKPSVNIITVEDPVEYAIPGLNQVQVNTKAGLTFATSLRSILRQDPNIIMIGEIRDQETAEIALKSAQTGHLVLSTLHTNDSISAVTRLLDLGIPGFQIAASMTGIIAQRLIRRLCSCRKQVPVTPEYIAQFLQAGAPIPPSVRFTANGCDDCDLSGYKGRIGIYEMLVLDDAVRSAIRDTGRTDAIRALARANGMRFMHEYALEHAQQGLTSLEEVQRVVPIEQTATLSCLACQRELSPAFVFCPFCGERRANPEFRPQLLPLVEQGVVNE
jgi:type IV pilus assembly protein PilB